MEETDMAVVVSPSQNEAEDLKKKGVDITPHRRRMVTEDLDEKFKDTNRYRLGRVGRFRINRKLKAYVQGACPKKADTWCNRRTLAGSCSDCPPRTSGRAPRVSRQGPRAAP